MRSLGIIGLSQIGSDATHLGDCWAVSGVMLDRIYRLLLQTTPDQFFDLVKPVGEGGITMARLAEGLAKTGLRTELRTGFTQEVVYITLREKKPFIPIVHYGYLVSKGYTEFKNFTAGHFGVVDGADIEMVNFHDPYRTADANGVVAPTEIPIEIFMKAWEQCPLDGNVAFTAIVPVLPIQDLSGFIPSGDEYVMIQKVENCINVRESATSKSKLLYTLWKIDATHPIIHIVKISPNGLWGNLDTGGWVAMEFLKKV